MSVEINVTDQIIEVTPTAGQIDVNITEIPVVVNATDQIIEIADTGLQGPQGPAGPGVPTGGTTGQILVKSSNTNFDTGWSSTNATLGEYGLSAGYLKVDTTPTNTPADQGTMYWDDNAETVALIMNGTIQKIGEDLFFHVQNKTGSPIPKGTCVRFDGTDGNSGKILIAPFIANGTYPSQYFMGVAAETIANGDNGKVYHFGKIRGVNTSAYQKGDILYASTTVAGGFQTSVPTAPNNIIIVAAVISAANNGTLMIRSTLGSNINNDEGVKITNPTNGQVLKYNSTTGLWENATAGGTGTVTSVDASGGTGISVSGGPITTSGTLTITNTAPDQVVALTGGGTTSISGTYPNFTITSNDQYSGTVTSVDASGGTGISVSGGPITSSGSLTITNTAPDQVVSLTGTGTTSISGTYPNFTINSDDQYDGTVTSVDLTAGTGISVSGGPITSSGSITVTNTAPDQVVSISGGGTTSISGTYPNFTVSSADQYTGTVTSVDASVPTGFSISGNPITSSGTLAIGFASGYSLPTNAKQTEWDSAYTNRITSLTTTGSSGAATLSSNTLNIPNYTLSGLGGVPSSRTLTVNGTGYDLSADRSWSVGTITSLTGEATASGSGAVSVTLDNASVIGKVLTGLNLTGGGSIVFTDSILQAFGKLQNQISALFGSVQYEGVWNASTNSPTIASGTGSKGDYYVVNVAGGTTIDGISDWKIGDWIIFNGTTWDKVDNTDAVSSVNGFTGAVSLSTSNIGEGTNLYFTNTRAQNAITLTTSGTSGSATYSGGTLNIPTYSLSGLGGVPTSRTLTINGTAFDLSADRSWSVGTVTSVGLTAPTGFAVSNSPITSSGNIALAFAAGYSLPTTASQTNWDAAYNDKINSAAVTGTTTKTLTLTQQDGGTITASWTDLNTDAVTSVFGRTGAVVATSGDYNTSQVTESGNLYYTDARARAAISLTTNNTSGAATYNSSTGVINIPQYQAALTNPVTGTGTPNYVAKFTGTGTTIGDSNLINDASGNLGLGVTPSAWSAYKALQIGNASFVGFGNQAEIFNNAFYDGAFKYYANGTANWFKMDQGAFSFHTAPFGTAGNAITFTQAMTLDASGRLGIANNSPSYVLDVIARASGEGGVRFWNNRASTSTIDAIALNLHVSNSVGQTGGKIVVAENTTDSWPTNMQFWVNGGSSSYSPTQAMTITSSGRLLLGTTTDNTVDRLQVNGSAFFNSDLFTYNNGGIFFSGSGTFTSGIFQNASGLQLQSGGSPRLTIASTGAATFSSSVTAAQVSIGTTSPATFLHVNGATAALPNGSGTTQSAGNRIRLSTAAGTGILDIGCAGGTGMWLQSTDLTDLSLKYPLLLNPNGGNVGIGTTSPSGILGILIGGIAEFIINQSGTGDNYYTSGTSGSQVFRTGTTERMRITSGGNVLIGSTTDNGVNKLQVTGGLRTTVNNTLSAITVVNTSSSNKQWDISPFNDDLAINESNVGTRMYFKAGGEVIVSGTTDNGAYNLQCNGTGVWGAGAYVNGSDIRLKDNIKDIDEGLSLINKIRAVTFTYKENYSKDRNVQTGFIAQELQEVFKDKDYLNGLVQEGPEYLNVAYQNIIPILVKAIQELKSELDILKQKN